MGDSCIKLVLKKTNGNSVLIAKRVDPGCGDEPLEAIKKVEKAIVGGCYFAMGEQYKEWCEDLSKREKCSGLVYDYGYCAGGRTGISPGDDIARKKDC